MRRNITFFFYSYLLCYLAVVLINLDKLPVAWVDETMNLDPAVQFLKTGHFASKIWPQEGTENIFLAYMPVTSFVQVINLSIVPATIFFTRLPGLLFLLLSCFFLFRIYRVYYHLAPLLSILLLLLFMHDEGITNAMRSGRAEIILLGLLAPALFLMLKNRFRVIAGILLSMIWLTHPAAWIIVLLGFVWLFLQAPSLPEKFLHIILAITPVFIYLLMAGFDTEEIRRQLISHSEEHNADAVKGFPLFMHFIDRFLPVYKVQPWIPLLHALILIYSVIKIIVRRREKDTLIEFLFLGTTVYWIFALAPFYRYTPTLILLMFIILPRMIRDIRGQTRRMIRWHKLRPLVIVMSALLLILSVGPFWFRNVIALIQREERKAETVYAWLDRELDKPGKKLLIDASVGHFYSLQRKNIDFSLTYSLHKFRFSDYDAVYYLTQRAEPDPHWLQSAILLPKSPLSQQIRKYYFIATYDGLRLYRVPGEKEMMKLLRK